MSTGERRALAVLVGIFMVIAPSGTMASVDVDEEEVVFRYPGKAETVYVTGDFNNWNPTIDRMISREGSFEIRLYLLPGRYRYRFVVDGTEIADPDNPWRDQDGNTFFIFRETEDGYEVVFEGTLESGAYIEKEEYRLGADLFAALNEETGIVRFAPRLEAVIGEGLKADISASLGLDDQEDPDFVSRPLSAEMTFTRGSLALGAFSRAGEDALGDPASIWSTDGPYGHSSWYFRRGIYIGMESRSGLHGKLVYSDRLAGDPPYIRTTEIFSLSTGGELLVSRDPVDSDITGFTCGFSGKDYSLDYVFRHDEGRGRAGWTFPDSLTQTRFEGTERIAIHAVTLSAKRGKFGFDAAYANGVTRLDPVTEEGTAGEIDPVGKEWDSGDRISAAVTFVSASKPCGVSWERESVAGFPLEGQWDDEMVHDRVSVSLGWNTSKADVRLEYIDDDYSGGRHRHFRQGLYNFWLDEDVVRPSDLFFADSRGHSSLRFSLDEKDGEQPMIPYQVAGTFSAEFSSVKADRDIWRLEARLARGIRLDERFAIHLDMRYIRYGHPSWEGKDSFLDLWAGLSIRSGAGRWITAGIGKAPVSFDEWIYDFTPFARDKYLLGSLSRAAGPDMPGGLEMIRDAERSLSEDWGLSVQAGLSF